MGAIPVRECMSSFPVCIEPEKSLHEAKSLMREHGIRHLPVRDGQEVLGMVSTRDIHFALSVDRRSAEELRVKDCFTPNAYKVTPETDVAEIAAKLAEDKVGGAIVIDSDDKLVGIFTTTDCCRVLAKVLETPGE